MHLFRVFFSHSAQIECALIHTQRRRIHSQALVYGWLAMIVLIQCTLFTLQLPLIGSSAFRLFRIYRVGFERETHVGSLICYSGMYWYRLCERLFLCLWESYSCCSILMFVHIYIYTIIATLISLLEILPSKWRPQSCDYCSYGRRHDFSLQYCALFCETSVLKFDYLKNPFQIIASDSNKVLKKKTVFWNTHRIKLKFSILSNFDSQFFY